MSIYRLRWRGKTASVSQAFEQGGRAGETLCAPSHGRQRL